MPELFSEFIPDFLEAITQALKDEEYLIKGGQAILYHMKTISASKDARFSRDLDISLSSDCFPIDIELFKNKLVENYNTISNLYSINIDDIIVRKLPSDEDLYFGIRLVLNVHRKNKNGIMGKKVYFQDLEGLAVVIDFNCSEFVDANFIEFVENKIRIATIPLIVAEKFRALCTQLENINPRYKPTPRPKDFFDIFLIFNKYYQKNPTEHNIHEIKEAMKKCFERKSMDLELLNQLFDDNVKYFHESMFSVQVLNTLPTTSIYKDVTYDQVYSESLELLDKLL